MTTLTIDDSQRNAARVVGLTYLIAMFASVFTEVFVRGKLIVLGDPAATARNIMAGERLFRVSIGIELLTFVGTVMLLAALYVILRPVNPHLAFFAAALRLIEAATCVAMSLTSLDVLRLLSGADYLRAIEPAQLQAMARMSISAHATGYNVAFVFLGLGSTVFSWLWLKSGYIPRALALLGLLGSVLLALGSFFIIIFPSLYRTLGGMAYMMPLGLFEVGMGVWLLLKGLQSATSSHNIHHAHPSTEADG